MIKSALVDRFGDLYSAPDDEVRINCPYCYDTAGHCYVNVVKKQFNCFRCNYGGSAKSLFRKLGLPYEEEEVITLHNRELDEDDPGLPVEFSPIFPITDEKEALLALSYLRKRGVKLKQIKDYNIGYCKKGRYENRVVIPVDGGRSFVARSWERKPFKKVLMPKMRKNDLLFNFNENAKRAVLVEGVFDALRVGKIAVGLLGSNISFAQLSRLKNSQIEEVVLMLDSDTRGVKILSLVQKLFPYFFVRVVDLKTGDPGSMKREHIRREIDASGVWSREDILRYSLSTC